MKSTLLVSIKSYWLTVSVGSVLLIAMVAAAIGFIWIPITQNGSTVTTFWDAICSAAGVPDNDRAAAVAAKIATTGINRPSNLIAATAVLGTRDEKVISRGAKLAQQCTVCHIAHGTNATAFPNLAAQIDKVIYKQLSDFKAGHRSSLIMQPIAMSLDDRSMRDLAAYYADLPRIYPLQSVDPSVTPPVLVLSGAPMRGIAACASCHGENKNSAFTPRLEGLPVDYLSTQLMRFSGAERHNDINAQMRNAARHLTPNEIVAVSHYYASQ